MLVRKWLRKEKGLVVINRKIIQWSTFYKDSLNVQSYNEIIYLTNYKIGTKRWSQNHLSAFNGSHRMNIERIFFCEKVYFIILKNSVMTPFILIAIVLATSYLYQVCKSSVPKNVNIHCTKETFFLSPSPFIEENPAFTLVNYLWNPAYLCLDTSRVKFPRPIYVRSMLILWWQCLAFKKILFHFIQFEWKSISLSVVQM